MWGTRQVLVLFALVFFGATTSALRISRRGFLKALAALVASFVVPASGCVSVELRRGGAASVNIISGPPPPAGVTRSGLWRQTTSADFQAGTHFKTRVVDVEDGAVTLAVGAPEGNFTSSIKKTEFAFIMVGVAQDSRIPPGAASDIEVRTSQNGTVWSDWVAVRSKAAGGQSGKDDDLARTTVVRPGSYLQYRVLFTSAGEAPVLAEVTITYLDSSQGPTIVEAKNALLPKVVGRPPIIAREGWGADEKLRFDANGKEIWPAEYSKPVKLVIHHTETPNDETSAPSLVRAIYYYHAVTQGWGDIGYHFLIDGSGNIYEGRRGDGIVGGHAYGHNYGSVGIAILGDYTAANVTDATQKALISLLIWLCGKYGIDPNGHSFFVDRDLQNIYGHRDSNQTSCPGDNLYNVIPIFRKSVVFSSASTWYFAEGATVPGFQTWLLMLNPNSSSVKAGITFYDESGQTSHSDVLIGPNSRLNVLVNNLVSNKAVGIKVEAEQAIYVERSVFFGHDGHSSTGANDLSQTWYFAEGSTEPAFNTWLLLLNPNAAPAHFNVNYYRPDGSVVTKAYTIGATSRLNIPVNKEVPNTAVAMKVESDAPIVAERSMYFDQGRGGHNTLGVPSPSQTWYFAEGASGPAFSTWILLLNPNADPAQTTLTFLQENGQSQTASYAIPPRTRMNVLVNKLVPPGGVATKIQADRAIVAERSMYWADGRAGHTTIGATAPANQWFLPEGSTASFNEWLLIMNPNGDAGKVAVTLVDERGNSTARSFDIAGNSRLSVWVNQIIPAAAISAIVQCDRPIIAERSSYSLDNLGGTNSMGIPR